MREKGVVARTGRMVAGYRLHLAVESGGTRPNIECDGAALHVDKERTHTGIKLCRLPGGKWSDSVAGRSAATRPTVLIRFCRSWVGEPPDVVGSVGRYRGANKQL